MNKKIISSTLFTLIIIINSNYINYNKSLPIYCTFKINVWVDHDLLPIIRALNKMINKQHHNLPTLRKTMTLKKFENLLTEAQFKLHNQLIEIRNPLTNHIDSYNKFFADSEREAVVKKIEDAIKDFYDALEHIVQNGMENLEPLNEAYRKNQQFLNDAEHNMADMKKRIITVNVPTKDKGRTFIADPKIFCTGEAAKKLPVWIDLDTLKIEYPHKHKITTKPDKKQIDKFTEQPQESLFAKYTT